MSNWSTTRPSSPIWPPSSAHSMQSLGARRSKRCSGEPLFEKLLCAETLHQRHSSECSAKANDAPEIVKRDKFPTHIFSFLSDIISFFCKTGPIPGNDCS